MTKTLYGSHRIEQIKQRLNQNYITGINKMAEDIDADSDQQVWDKVNQVEQMANELVKNQRRYELVGGATGFAGGLGIGTAIGNRLGYGATGALGGLVGLPIGSAIGKSLYNRSHKGDINEYNSQVEELNRTLDKQATYDPRTKELEGKYQEAEDNLMRLTNQVPESIRKQQRQESNKHSLLGSATGALAGAGVGGLLGRAKGMVPFLKPAPVNGAIVGGLGGAFTGALLGAAKGYSNGQQILHDYDPNLPNQLNEAMQKSDEAENALYEHLYRV